MKQRMEEDWDAMETDEGRRTALQLLRRVSYEEVVHAENGLAEGAVANAAVTSAQSSLLLMSQWSLALQDICEERSREAEAAAEFCYGLPARMNCVCDKADDIIQEVS